MEIKVSLILQKEHDSLDLEGYLNQSTEYCLFITSVIYNDHVMFYYIVCKRGNEILDVNFAEA